MFGRGGIFLGEKFCLTLVWCHYIFPIAFNLPTLSAKQTNKQVKE